MSAELVSEADFDLIVVALIDVDSTVEVVRINYENTAVRQHAVRHFNLIVTRLHADNILLVVCDNGVIEVNVLIVFIITNEVHNHRRGSGIEIIVCSDEEFDLIFA